MNYTENIEVIVMVGNRFFLAAACTERCAGKAFSVKLRFDYCRSRSIVGPNIGEVKNEDGSFG